MNKSVWVILALGLGCMVLLFYVSTNWLQSDPQLRRFFLIRNTIAEEYGLPKESIRMSARASGRARGIDVTLPDPAGTASLELEKIAGRVFEIEAELKKEQGSRRVTYFREVVFVGEEDLKLGLSDLRKRSEVRASLGAGGRLRNDLAGMLEVDADAVDLEFVEESGRLSGAEVGVRLILDGKGDEADREMRAAEAGEIAFGRLAGKIHFFRILFRTDGSERIYTARAKAYFEERRISGGPGKVRWSEVFEVE